MCIFARKIRPDPSVGRHSYLGNGLKGTMVFTHPQMQTT